MTGVWGAQALVLRRHLGVTVVPDEGAYLLSEHGSAVLTDPEDAALAARLAEPGAVASAASPAPALARLDDAGLLAPAGAGGPRREEGYWHTAGRIAQGTALIALHVHGDIDAAEARDRLAGCGVEVTAEAAVPLAVVLTDDLAVADAAESLRAAGIPWLLAKPVGVRIAVGPLFTADGPCHRCLAHVLTARSPARRYLTERTGAAPLPPVVDLSATRTVAYGMVATAVRQFQAGHPVAAGTVRTLDTLTWEAGEHRMRRRPQCPGCGDPSTVARRMSAPVVPTGRTAGEQRDGGWRSSSAAEFLARNGGLADRLTGVVGPLTPVASDLEGVHAWTAGPNPAVRITTLHDLRSGLRAHSSGKGDTEVQARASALGEALERAGAVYAGDEPVRRSTLRLLGGAGIAPNAVQLYSAAQYAGRAEWNARGQTFQHVCDPLPPDTEIDWSPVWSLTHGRTRWLPTSLLFFGHREPEATFAWADSNGCAAGSSLEDALLQAIYELIERDAVAIWWYNRLRRPGLDLAAAGEPAARRFAAHAELGRQLVALDITSDLNVPTVAAVSARNAPREDIVFGFGTHTDQRIALGRALAEVDQFLPAVTQARDDGTGYASQDPAQLHWWRTARLAGHRHLVPSGPDLPIGPPVPAPDLGQEVRRLQALLEARGLELLALDMTRPDVEVPVVRAVVPGLRHFWARFGPGRLYDVPVAMGERAAPAAEDELNPVPVFV